MSRNILACCQEHEAHTLDSVLITGECGHKIWVSKSGLAAIKEHDLEARCMACVPVDMEVQSLPSIMEEVAGLIGKEEAEITLRLLQNPASLKVMILRAQLSSLKVMILRAQLSRPTRTRWQ